MPHGTNKDFSHKPIGATVSDMINTSGGIGRHGKGEIARLTISGYLMYGANPYLVLASYRQVTGKLKGVNMSTKNLIAFILGIFVGVIIFMILRGGL